MWRFKFCYYFLQLLLYTRNQLFAQHNTSTSPFYTTTKLTIADRSIDWLCSCRTSKAASSWRPERRSTAAATCWGWWVGCGGGRRRGARIGGGGGGGGGEGKDGGVVGGGGGWRAVAALSSTHARSYEQIVIITFDLHNHKWLILASYWFSVTLSEKSTWPRLCLFLVEKVPDHPLSCSLDNQRLTLPGGPHRSLITTGSCQSPFWGFFCFLFHDTFLHHFLWVWIDHLSKHALPLDNQPSELISFPFLGFSDH